MAKASLLLQWKVPLPVGTHVFVMPSNENFTMEKPGLQDETDETIGSAFRPHSGSHYDLAPLLDHHDQVHAAPHNHWRISSSLAPRWEDDEVQAVFACDARYSWPDSEHFSKWVNNKKSKPRYRNANHLQYSIHGSRNWS